MSPDSKTAPQSPRDPARACTVSLKAYSAPRLRSLGSVSAMTLTTSSQTDGGLNRRKPQG
jgi:hypothetical protein